MFGELSLIYRQQKLLKSSTSQHVVCFYWLPLEKTFSLQFFALLPTAVSFSTDPGGTFSPISLCSAYGRWGSWWWSAGLTTLPPGWQPCESRRHLPKCQSRRTLNSDSARGCSHEGPWKKTFSCRQKSYRKSSVISTFNTVMLKSSCKFV